MISCFIVHPWERNFNTWLLQCIAWWLRCQDRAYRIWKIRHHALPRIASDADGSYQGFAEDSLIHKTEGFDYYDDFSMWDTFRGLHPLMTIIEPEKSLAMARSLVLKAQLLVSHSPTPSIMPLCRYAIAPLCLLINLHLNNNFSYHRAFTVF